MEEVKLTIQTKKSQAEEAAASLGERTVLSELPSEPFNEGITLAMEEARRISRNPKAKTYATLTELRTDLEG